MAGLGHGSNIGSTVYNSRPAVAEVHLMLVRFSSGPEAKGYISRRIYCADRDICCPRIRIGLSCIDRYVEEADLTETILGQDASPVVVSREPDVPCCYTTEVNSCIVCVVGCARRLGKLGSCTQCHIVGAVDRILDCNIFDPETYR